MDRDVAKVSGALPVTFSSSPTLSVLVALELDYDFTSPTPPSLFPGETRRLHPQVLLYFPFPFRTKPQSSRIRALSDLTFVFMLTRIESVEILHILLPPSASRLQDLGFNVDRCWVHAPQPWSALDPPSHRHPPICFISLG